MCKKNWLALTRFSLGGERKAEKSELIALGGLGEGGTSRPPILRKRRHSIVVLPEAEGGAEFNTVDGSEIVRSY